MIQPRIWSGEFAGAGLYIGMPADEYHRDTHCPAPSLSSGTARTIIDQSPAHVAFKHPRLNPQHVEEETSRAMQVGSATHKLALGAGSDLEVVHANDYRTNAARAARDTAIGAGKIPILAHEHEVAKALAHPLQLALEEWLGAPIEECWREVVIFWQEGEAWRRAMLDAVAPDLLRIGDLKTTAISVAPPKLQRYVFDNGLHIQSAHYTRGLDAFDPENIGRRQFAFIFTETKPPCVISPPITISEAGRQLASEQLDLAATIFDDCLARNFWPGYGARPISVDPMPWTLRDWEDRAMAAGRDQVRCREYTAEQVYGEQPEETEA